MPVSAKSRVFYMGCKYVPLVLARGRRARRGSGSAGRGCGGGCAGVAAIGSVRLCEVMRKAVLKPSDVNWCTAGRNPQLYMAWYWTWRGEAELRRRDARVNSYKTDHSILEKYPTLTRVWKPQIAFRDGFVRRAKKP